jgi:hypothetical protein
MLERVEVEKEEREYLPCGRGSKLTITGDDTEAAHGAFHGGKLDLHLPKVGVEEAEQVEEHPRASHSPRSAEEVAGVEHDFKTKTLDQLQDPIEPSRM